MERKQIEQVLALALGPLLIGIGFTMRGDLDWQRGTALAALGIVLVLASAVSMYRTWRAHRRTATSLRATLANEPLLPSGFHIHKQEPRAGKNPLAPHVLWAELEIEPPIGGYLLCFFCNGPVYREACSFQQEGLDVGATEAGPESNSVAVRVGGRGFHSPGTLTVELASVAPLKIVRIASTPDFRRGGMPATRGEAARPGEPTPTLAIDSPIALAVEDFLVHLHDAELFIYQQPQEEKEAGWDRLRQPLEEFRAAVAQSDKLNRPFLFRVAELVNRAQKTRAIRDLLIPMAMLDDMCWFGAFDLNVSLSDARFRVISAHSKPHFVVDVYITNNESTGVILRPRWHFHYQLISAPHYPDAEPLAEWESLRPNSSDPAVPPLDVPLKLEAGTGVVGYWSFKVAGNLGLLVDDKVSQITHFLEVYDLLSKNRARLYLPPTDYRELSLERKSPG